MNPNDQAFPRSYATGLLNENGQHELKSITGLTKREYFACEFVKAFVANPFISQAMTEAKLSTQEQIDKAIEAGRMLTNALIAELSK